MVLVWNNWRGLFSITTYFPIGIKKYDSGNGKSVRHESMCIGNSFFHLLENDCVIGVRYSRGSEWCALDGGKIFLGSVIRAFSLWVVLGKVGTIADSVEVEQLICLSWCIQIYLRCAEMIDRMYQCTWFDLLGVSNDWNINRMIWFRNSLDCSYKLLFECKLIRWFR